ncbi:hypothetical protein [Mesorhizobium sp. ZC-5]|jgi:hypothetical protein|uniref:hypothetical protein n=1 Tax=Mesorhizobium sp. ZC-5 TaxID=2986066 RepID=UPI0021E84EC0|nr:hypothetical protein [Mesorhizobium sp. ZC-5]MCV3241145.1 hypothetical protein [Mesorhizobium sp. ZC-5]
MRLAFAAVALLTAGAAAAATLDLPGVYGSPEGCKYLKDQTLWEEAVTVLTSTQYKDFVTECEYVQVLPASDGSRIVTMLCQQELDVQTVEIVRVVKTPNGDAYRLFNAEGGRLAELSACPT